MEKLDIQALQGRGDGWEEWMGVLYGTLAHVKEEMLEGHPLTVPVLGWNQNNQEQWKSVVIHLTGAFPGCFWLGEWDAFILWCSDEVW